MAGGALAVGFFVVERFPELLGPIPELTALRVIEGPVSHVRDGDTIEVVGVPVRFGSLDCAERETQAGQVATRGLRELIAGQSLTCALNGRTSYDRSIGRCTLPDGRDLAALMIREGLCGRYW
ncbi:thermonuclease family protein [Falsigemmobacter intermedius]|uniref:Thermonuclease family protein n=1 Tax=Falsigemmobacter intermedius TaxID=1553448 RepID=A0A444M8V9_9RHOB|nr:thermonuclease family protein [Falsigemmobacter intermedius]RWY39095.1 thermonuclease family protein [Falsigemmobacter intermedius]